MKSENWAKTEALLAPCMADKPTAGAVIVLVSSDNLQVVSLNLDKEEAELVLALAAAHCPDVGATSEPRVLQ